MIKRAIFYGTSQDKFNKHFTSDDDCFKYLSEIKWKDDTFVCTRCGNTHYCKGHLPFQDVVQNASMTKARLQVQCLIN